MKVPFNYLQQQFPMWGSPDLGMLPDNALTRDIFKDIAVLVNEGDYTLGRFVERFESAFADALGCRNAIGVSNGTDALFLSLKVVNAKKVITVANTFLATVGAAIQAGCSVEFVDVDSDYLMVNQGRAEPDSTLLPVDLTGRPVAWSRTPKFAAAIVRDSCQAVGAKINGLPLEKYGDITTYSLHPLKNINCFGDGGVVCTESDKYAEDIRLLRNHGLESRDVCSKAGYNMRLSSIQAIPAYHTLKTLEELTEKRILNARRYDKGLKDCKGVQLPPRDLSVREVHHTYVIQVDDRDGLEWDLMSKEIEVKIHYRTPIHLTEGYKFLGYSEGDLPETERQAKRILTLPANEFITPNQIDFVIESIQGYYNR